MFVSFWLPLKQPAKIGLPTQETSNEQHPHLFHGHPPVEHLVLQSGCLADRCYFASTRPNPSFATGRLRFALEVLTL